MQLGLKEFDNSTAVAGTDHAGFCAGTTIMTLQGEMPVEALQPGDKIITRDAGMAVLRKVTAHTVKARTVRIKAGSLGHTRPDRDMMVMEKTPLHIRDWRAEALFGQQAAIVEASRLLDGEFISVQEPQDVTVYALTFDRQHIVYADGMEVASVAI